MGVVGPGDAVPGQLVLSTSDQPPPLPLASAAGGATLQAMTSAHERRGLAPVLRWSFLRMGLHAKRLNAEGRLGDGREDALAEHVVTHARAGDVDDVIRTIDEPTPAWRGVSMSTPVSPTS